MQVPASTVMKVTLRAGLLAGTLDILAAFTQFYIMTGKSPLIVLKYIASAVFGRDRAYAEGYSMIFLGLLFHYLIALSFALLFIILYLKWPLIRKKIILSGFVYGLFVWAVMNLVVVPLSRVATPSFDLKKALIAALILVTMIGIPIALVTRKYFPPGSSQ